MGKRIYSEAEREQMRAIGRRIRLARCGRGLKLEQLARLAGSNRADLSRYENGLRDLRVLVAIRLADALGVPVRWLLRGPKPEEMVAAAAKAPGVLG